MTKAAKFQGKQGPHSLHRVITLSGHAVIILFVCLDIFFGGNVFAATYYVSTAGSDSNSGAQAAPWRSIGQAAAAMKAGDTSIVMDGTYVEKEVRFQTSGTQSAPITLKAQNKGKAILSSISSCNPNISIRASYVTIADMNLQINSSNVYCAPNSASGTGVRCWEQTLPTVSSPSTGYVGCAVRGTTIDGPVLGNGSRVRSHGGKSNQDYAVIENNTMAAGVETVNNTNNVIRNNTITGPDAWGNGIVAKGGSRNTQIYNNTLNSSSINNWGIVLGGSTGNQWLFDPPSGTECYNCVAYDNVIMLSNNVSSLGLYGARDSGFYNNVVFGGTIVVRASGGATVNPTFENNIYNCKGGSVTGGLSYSGTLTINYNDFYSCSSVPSQRNPIVGDPMFVNPSSDWHLQAGSPAIGSGVVLSVPAYGGGTIDISKDYVGVSRTAPWSLGIYAGTSLSAGDTPPPAPTGLVIF